MGGSEYASGDMHENGRRLRPVLILSLSREGQLVQIQPVYVMVNAQADAQRFNAGLTSKSYGLRGPSSKPGSAPATVNKHAGLAQLEERRLCNSDVVGSNPTVSSKSNLPLDLAPSGALFLH